MLTLSKLLNYIVSKKTDINLKYLKQYRDNNGGDRHVLEKETAIVSKLEYGSEKFIYANNTKCEITATTIRDILNVNVMQWTSQVPETQKIRKFEKNDLKKNLGPSQEICQVEFGGGEHWITYLPETGEVFHSWYNKFELKCEKFEPGLMTIPKAMEILDILCKENNIPRETVKCNCTDIVIYNPTIKIDVMSAHKRFEEHYVNQ